MARHILRCKKCGSYTMKSVCSCKGEAVTVKPPKYSPDSKYADLTRKARRKMVEEKGLL